VTGEADSAPAARRSAVAAAFLAWTLDSFDYFLVVFVLARIAHDFGTDVKEVTFALFLTLAFRPLGAFLFGRIADHFGRRPALMGSVLVYSVIEFASALSPSLPVFLVLRALFGIGMGGAWGVGASLAFESIPVRQRGMVSGLLQSGYPTGYLLAAIVFGLLVPVIGWRGMLMVGTAPALLSWFIVTKVPESPTWLASRGARSEGTSDTALAGRGSGAEILPALRKHWALALYAVVLMTAFNFFSHGTQDLYPTFLGVQRGLSTGAISRIAILYNLGAICGGITFGRLSSRIGRRRTIALAALLSIPALPFWAYSTSTSAIAAAAFAMQFMVQGAWGVVPVHLNELSPEGVRATFPGVVYQLGNLLAAANAPLQAYLAVWRGGSAQPDYAFALMLVCVAVIPTLILLALTGPERRDPSPKRSTGTWFQPLEQGIDEPSQRSCAPTSAWCTASRCEPSASRMRRRSSPRRYSFSFTAISSTSSRARISRRGCGARRPTASSTPCDGGAVRPRSKSSTMPPRLRCWGCTVPRSPPIRPRSSAIRSLLAASLGCLRHSRQCRVSCCCFAFRKISIHPTLHASSVCRSTR